MRGTLKNYWPEKWPSGTQWKKFPQILSGKEKAFFFTLLIIVFASFFYIVIGAYFSFTEIVPSAGGTYREGFVGSTKLLNINPTYPIYASQSDAEHSIIEVVFDGLLRYNKNGQFVPHLAKDFSTKDGRVYHIILRDDIYWSDGEKITADDVIFTVNTIQNPDFQSSLRQNWAGVRSEKVSSKEVRFTLDGSSAVFLENLTLKIIPKHIFGDLSPRDFYYSSYNMKIVGSGPYRYKEIKEGSEGKIESLVLERNPYYFRSDPLISEVVFRFFPSQAELVQAKRKGEIDGFVIPDGRWSEPLFQDLRGFKRYEFPLSRYFAVFFNLKAPGSLEEPGVRQALNYATNKEAIIEEALDGHGKPVDSPILSRFYGYADPQTKYSYQPSKAKEILKKEGFENGKREPENPFLFTEDLKSESQGEEVRNLQRCFIYLRKEDEELYPEGEITGFFDENTKQAVNHFQETYRKEILEPHGFTSGTGMVARSTRKKLNELCDSFFNAPLALSITITTIDDPLLAKTAKKLQEQWSNLEIEVAIKKTNLQTLKEDYIRPRAYEALLLGTTFNHILNPFPLWHSSKAENSGLNLSGYENEEVDKLLEEIIANEEREEALLELQEIILEDAPAVFLYDLPLYYSVSERIRGVEERKLTNPSLRFLDIDYWYISTKRTFRR